MLALLAGICFGSIGRALALSDSSSVSGTALAMLLPVRTFHVAHTIGATVVRTAHSADCSCARELELTWIHHLPQMITPLHQLPQHLRSVPRNPATTQPRLINSGGPRVFPAHLASAAFIREVHHPRGDLTEQSGQSPEEILKNRKLGAFLPPRIALLNVRVRDAGAQPAACGGGGGQ